MKLAAGACCLALAAASCGPSGDPVEALLEALEAAVEEKDADAVAARLSPDFQTASGQSREDATQTLKRLLLGYETVEVERIASEVERGEGSAVVRCWVGFSGRARPVGGLAGLLPPDATYRFDVDAVESEAGWRVSRLGWERVETRVE